MARNIHKNVADRIVRDGAVLMDQRIPGYTWRDRGHYYYHPQHIAAWLHMEYNAAMVRMGSGTEIARLQR